MTPWYHFFVVRRFRPHRGKAAVAAVCIRRSSPYHCIVTCDYVNSLYCIALALINAQRGRMRHGFAFAGENAHRATEILSVKELVTTLLDEYRAAAA